MTKPEALFLEDAYPGADFWEVEKTFEVKVKVIAEAETPEEEPAVSFSRAVLDQSLPGVVEFPDEIDLWIEDYFKQHPEAAKVFEDMCKALAFKTGGQIAIQGATRGPTKADPRIGKIGKLLSELGINPEDED
ncbi:hypothetical protein OAA10_00395 [bacterium]|nr:hypothetical protein [bacterium]